MNFLRHVWTAIRGRRPCDVASCGRAARCYGFCTKHMSMYRYDAGVTHVSR